MNSEIFVQQTGNIQSIAPRARRKANDRSTKERTLVDAEGQQTIARMDGPQTAPIPVPHSRAVQLEHYVAQIREKQEARANQATAPAPTTAAPERRGFSSNPIDALTRIDDARETIARQNFQAATTPQRVAGAVPQSATESSRSIDDEFQKTLDRLATRPASEQSASKDPDDRSTAVDIAVANDAAPASRTPDELIATISAAIASVISDISPNDLEHKVRQEIQKRQPESLLENMRIDAPAPVETTSGEHTFKPSRPHFMRSRKRPTKPSVEQPPAEPEPTVEPELVQPVVEPEPIQAEPVQVESAKAELISQNEIVASVPEDTTTIAETTADQMVPTEVAAWDVDDFRWPDVVNEITGADNSPIDSLVEHCLSMLGGDHSRLIITSPARGAGCSTIAMAIAKSAAADGKQVLLVDADLENPSLSCDIGLVPHISWSSAARFSQPACEATIRSQETQLCVMPLGKIANRNSLPNHLIDRLSEMLAAVENKFDLVVVDAGPITQMLNEASGSTKVGDAAILVYGEETQSAIAVAGQELTSAGVSNLIAVQNSPQG